MSDDRPVLLVNPRVCSRRSARLPLSLLALGAVLEGRRRYRIVDGNFDGDATATVLAALAEEPHALVGVTVMPGPQVGPAIALSRAVKERFPAVPVAWGGYFPTLYPEAALNASYVDHVVRGAGEETLLELLERLPSAGGPQGLDSAADPSALDGARGLSYRAGGAVRHGADRPFRPPDDFPPYPYERLGDVARFLQPTYLGRRTAVHQAAIGCRYRCSFCGVVSMFGGTTKLSGPARLAAATSRLASLGADAVQFYDNNFFDAEESSVPLLEALARAPLPYWCYARPDTLAGFSARTWQLLRRSGLAMAYLGAEAASDEALRKMHKGAKVEHTLEVARRCREHGVVPEFSFCLGGPEDPEGEIERTLRFVKVLKGIHPECEVILYFYTPTPRRSRGSAAGPLPLAARYGDEAIDLPATPEEWTRPEWVNFVCHTDAPWLPQRTRQRVRDFARVLGCRFPTVQDVRTPGWGKAILAALASWRWSLGVYGNPWELDLARQLVPLKEPASEGL